VLARSSEALFSKRKDPKIQIDEGEKKKYNGVKKKRKIQGGQLKFS